MNQDGDQRVLNGPSKERQPVKTFGSTSARGDQAWLLAEQRHGLTLVECDCDWIGQPRHFAAGPMSLRESHLQPATILVAAHYPEIERS